MTRIVRDPTRRQHLIQQREQLIRRYRLASYCSSEQRLCLEQIKTINARLGE